MPADSLHYGLASVVRYALGHQLVGIPFKHLVNARILIVVRNKRVNDMGGYPVVGAFFGKWK